MTRVRKSSLFLYIVAFLNCALSFLILSQNGDVQLLKAPFLFCVLPTFIVILTLIKAYGKSDAALNLISIFYIISLVVLSLILGTLSESIKVIIHYHGSISLPLLRLFLLCFPFIYFDSIEDHDAFPLRGSDKNTYITALCVCLVLFMSCVILTTSFSYPGNYRGIYPELASMTFAIVIILGMLGAFVASIRSSFFTFIFLSTTFSAFFIFIFSVFWAISMHYKPAIFLGVILASYTVILTYIILVIFVILRNIYLSVSDMDNVLMKPLVFLVRHRQVSTIFLGLFICGVSFIAVYNFSKPTIHDKQYLGDMKTINIDYFTIIVPSSVILLEPKQFYLTFPEGDIIFSETSFGPNEAKRSEQSQIFAINNVSLPKPWLNGKIGNHSYQLFVKVEGRNLWIVLEMTCIDHLLIFRHFTKIPTDIIYTKDNVFSPKSGFERLIDPVATAKVFWFLSSVTKFMDYYKVEPRHGHIVRGDYRTVNGVILTHLHPPFDIKNSKVVLAYPGSSKVRIYAKGSFAPSRKSRNQLVESLISTLNALLHGSYQISYLADFSSVEVLGREEVSIQMPLTGDKDQIALNTFGTANFLDENLQTQNITLSLSALVNNKDELALQLGFWKLICQTLEYHHTIRPSNRDTFMEVPDYDALRVGMEISVRAASFSYFWQ